MATKRARIVRRPTPRARQRPATKPTGSRKLVIPKALREAEKKRLDKYIERWARRLLLVIDGEVRKLTEDEIQVAVHGMPKRRRGGSKDSKAKSRRNE